ncbi:DUF3037 domain-containing protein [Pendulispora rubella]|uniref:DUF3037 domain-containing protein n=1 Tax=Pendulispora rubella TaxID=2741070 RepID=A0ABZ2LLF4_9BACT
MRSAFDYAIVRVVPRVEREEFINAGIILFCGARDYLAARIALDEVRLLALWPGLRQADLELVRQHLAAIPLVCEGEGPIGQLPLRERWHWLTATRSTILQVSPPHAGLTDEPEEALARLMGTYC